MDASTAPPGFVTDQQGGQGPPMMVISQQAAGNHYRPPSGHVGPVIGVLAVIAVLGILAGLVGRLCGGRTVMGYGPRFDVEAWLESKCSSCLDGHVAPPRPRPPHHMHMNSHMVMESFPAVIPAAVPAAAGASADAGAVAGAGAGAGGWRSENASLRPRSHPHPEVLLRPLPTQQAPVDNRSNTPAAGRTEPEIRAVRDQEGQNQQPVDDHIEGEDEISDFSDQEDEELHHHHYEEQQQQEPHRLSQSGPSNRPMFHHHHHEQQQQQEPHQPH